MKKFKLICLDTYLEVSVTTIDNTKSLYKTGELTKSTATTSTNAQDLNGLEETNPRRLSSVRGCMDFICGFAGGGQNLLRKIEQLAHAFEQRHISGKKVGKLDR